MKRILFIFSLLFNLSCFAQTQAEMNAEAYAEFNESDKLLNEVYKTILSIYSSDVIFVENLKTSQRLWIQFRDAEMAMKYPDYLDNVYGSIHATCSASYLKELTDQRVETLKKWIAGVEEGDACKGSVRIIEEIVPDLMEKASIDKKGNVWLRANMKKDHRIFGYKSKDITSDKMILFSIFTNDVKNNPYECAYGAFYETYGMGDLTLKYLATENDFLRIAILENGEVVDTVYMLKKWFEFEE